MRFGVLGALEVRTDGGLVVPLTGPVRRQLLAALIARSGRPVSASALIADLWGASPPRTAAKTLQSHVVRLRQDLAVEPNSASEVIVTDPAGYRLDVDPEALDAVRFERAVDHARAALARNRPDESAELLADGLGEWRDEAYLEFGTATFAATERLRLTELRTAARELATDLALRRGESATLIGDLEDRVQREPYRERGWEQLMVAQYRSGRAVDALTTFRRARDRLTNDLGVDPGPALQRLERQLLNHDPELALPATTDVTGPLASDRCPYVGLASYGADDIEVFVGRERVTAQLVSRISDTSVVAVTGASGTGKSSLVAAGLIPSLRRGALPGSAAWRIVSATGGTATLPPGDPVPDLVVVDQAEELFTSGGDVAAFDRSIGELIERGARVVLVVRGDYYGHIGELPSIGDAAAQATMILGPLRGDELRRAVREPPLRLGLNITDDLVESILDEIASQPEALPLLSVAMVRTWENREGRTLTLAGYRNGGGVAGALENTAEATWAALDEEARGRAEQLLLRLALVRDGRWIRRTVPLDELPADSSMTSALSAFATARLIRVDTSTVTITHEALLTGWPRLCRLLDENRERAALVEHIRAAARAWHDGGRSPADLYRGARLADALAWREATPGQASEREMAFLTASATAADAELIDAHERAEREAAGRRRLRYAVALLAVLVGAAAAVGAVAVAERSTARRQENRAQRAALTADSRRLAALSLNAPDLSRAAQLAAAAYRLQDSPDSRNALLAALQRSEPTLFQLTTPARSFELLANADASRLYALGNDATVQVFDPAKPQVVGRYPARANDIAAVTPDGDLVVAGPASSDDTAGQGRVSLLDANTGSFVRTITTSGSDVEGQLPALATDRLAVVGTGGHDVDVFDLQRPQTRPRTLHFAATVRLLTAAKDRFAIATADQVVHVLDAGTGRTLRTWTSAELPRTATAAQSSLLAAAPDATNLAVVPADHSTSATILRANRAPLRLPSQSSTIARVGFSPDSSHIVIGTSDGDLTVYSAQDGSITNTLPAHSGAVTGVIVAGAAADTRIYTIGLDGKLIGWSSRTSAQLLKRTGPILAVADHAERFGEHAIVGTTPIQDGNNATAQDLFVLDPDTGDRRSWTLGLARGSWVNQTVASADGSRALVSVQDKSGRNMWQLWSLDDGHRITVIRSPSPGPDTLVAALSRDGTTAVVGAGANQVRVLALPSGRLLRTLQVPFRGSGAGRLEAVPWAFDPDGHLLVAGFDPGSGPIAPPGATTPDSRSDAQPNNRIALVDIHTGRALGQTSFGSDTPTAFAWSGDSLLLGTYGGRLRRYDARTLQLQADAGVVASGAVLSVSAAPDRRTVVTAGTDGAMSFWDLGTLSREGKRLLADADDDSPWWYAWYTASGEVVGLLPARASSEGEPTEQRFRYEGSAQRWLDEICRLSDRPLARSDWRQLVPDQPYRSAC